MTKQKLKIIYISLLIILLILVSIFFLLKNKSFNNVNKINPEDNKIISLVDYNEANLLYYNQNSNKLKVNELNLIKYVFNSDSKLSSNFSWWIKMESFENKSKELWINLVNYDLSLELIDYKTKKEINSGTIYVNNINIWEFKDGKFNWSFKWIKWIELFNILVRSSDYADWFIKLNSLNSASNFLYWKVLLKKSEFIKLDLSKWLEFKSEKFTIKWEKCSIINQDNTCFNWNAKFRYNFIPWDEANNYELSLSEMKAIDNWNIVTLHSWWMTFIDIIDEKWNYLKVDKNKWVEISYKVSKNDIDNMEKYKNNGQLKNDWYWFYDKNSMLWVKKEAEVKLDKNNLTWSAKIKEIY